MTAEIISAFMQKNIFLNSAILDELLKIKTEKELLDAALRTERKQVPLFLIIQ